MSILWCGGEDVDFPNGQKPFIETNVSRFRAAYARCAIGNSTSTLIKSTIFGCGPITSAWLSARIGIASVATIIKSGIGLGRSGTDKGLFLGCGASTAGKLTLYKYDGSTFTALATESGTSLTAGNFRIDLQMTNYGATATVNVYLNSNLVITYNGDTTVTAVTDLDSVYIGGGGSGDAYSFKISEVIVADEDTRLFSLVTNAPSAAGDANAWTGAYTAIDESTIDDSDVVYTPTADQDAQFALSDLPAGNFTVKAVKIAARSTKGATGIAGLSLGVKTGGTVNVDTPHTLTTAWTTEERLMLQNPVTSNAWQPSEINALQLDLRSGA